MREQDVVAELVRALLDGKDDARVNGVGDGGNDQAEKFGGRVRRPCAVESGT
jgi:hypothetical protein